MPDANMADLVRIAQAVPVGLASGMLSGAFGVGGGIISVPLTRHLLGVAPHISVGSTLAVILPTACVGIYNYHKQGKIVLPLALASGAPATIGSVAGAAGTKYLNGEQLMLILCALMLLVGVDFVSGFSNRARKSADAEPQEFVANAKSIGIASITGLLIGSLAGMVGVGGGFILVPLYCYAFGLPVKAAFGSSLIVVAMVALPGTVMHFVEGHVDTTLVFSLIAGSLPGAWLGSKLALKSNDEILKHAFGLVLIVMSALFAYRELTDGV